MLGVSSSLIASSTITAGDGAAISAAPSQLPPPQEAPESGGSSEGGGGGGDLSIGGEEGERNSGGNRWPRQETLALLKIRSEMDVVFKDSSLKGPLWEEVSRKMADLGYHRSAKKCKEKFENVYKYHRRTKDGRASKADGKTYRFFDQLQALENNPGSHSNLPPPPLAATPITMAMPMRSGNASVNPSMSMSQNHNHPFVVSQNTVVTAAAQPAVSHLMAAAALPLSQPQPITNNLNQMNRPLAQGNNTTTSFLSNSTSSSSTSSDEDIQRRHTKKRKWKELFESLMKDVIEKQEELQKKFLETLEKREKDRLMREETWRVQEMARLNREHDLLVQERSMAAAKDATIIAFLQKITEQQNTPILNSTNNTSPSPPPAQIQLKLSEKPLSAQAQAQPQPPAIAVSLPMTIHTPAPAPAPPQALTLPMVSAKSFEPPKSDNGGENFSPASSSRWPKEEIEALINLRTCLDLKYQENGPKGPLWEEISSEMRKIGYNRNAKRCKEKWENINKYFKKVKESNKKRPEDSKTCPYFHQLEALYKEKAKNEIVPVPHNAGFGLRSENNNPITPPPIMAQPEQQWPISQNQPQQHQHHHQQNRDHHDNESDSMDQNEDEDDMEEDGYEDDEEGNGYEIVTNKQPPSSIAAATVTTVTSATTAAV